MHNSGAGEETAFFFRLFQWDGVMVKKNVPFDRLQIYIFSEDPEVLEAGSPVGWLRCFC